MTAVRIAKAEDKKAFYDLWKICFGDSDAFCDWFFVNRFAPDYSVVLETEGKIVSCIQAFPYMLWIRGREIPGAMLCGVSTHPDYRKKGYMGQIFTYEMKLLRENGCTTHTCGFAELFSLRAFSCCGCSVSDLRRYVCNKRKCNAYSGYRIGFVISALYSIC